MNIMKALALALVVIIFIGTGLFTGCDRGKPLITPTIDREGVPITLTVFFYNTPQQVTTKYRQINNIDPSSHVQLRDGFAVWSEWRDEQGNSVTDPEQELTCEVHTAQPRRLEDQATMILGHEILHCIYGSYHR